MPFICFRQFVEANSQYTRHEIDPPFALWSITKIKAVGDIWLIATVDEMLGLPKQKGAPVPRPLQEPLQQGRQNSTWPTLPCGSAVQVLPLPDTRARRAQGCSFPESSDLTLRASFKLSS